VNPAGHVFAHRDSIGKPCVMVGHPLPLSDRGGNLSA
jgi:hypothetical protein